MTAWAEAVLDFWFGLEPKRWWRDDSLDPDIRRRFFGHWQRQRQCPAESFLGSPREALAAVILFDQFPRNMFRGHAEQFASDALALAVAKGAIDLGYDEEMSGPERSFLYMPFQHSEELRDQERSLLLYAALGEPEQLGYARKHHDAIARFGRFPHRNAILGRKPRADEIAAGDVVPW